MFLVSLYLPNEEEGHGGETARAGAQPQRDEDIVHEVLQRTDPGEERAVSQRHRSRRQGHGKAHSAPFLSACFDVEQVMVLVSGKRTYQMTDQPRNQPKN